MIKAINTFYNGHYFRSRTEARWAVYFDTLGVKWLYEVEGYELGDGVRYLPDFYFPDFDFYLEVKRENFGDSDLPRWKEFVMQSQKSLVIMEGLPMVDKLGALLEIQYGQVLHTEGIFIFGHITGKDVFYAGNLYDYSEIYQEAVIAARCARFEFLDNQQTKSQHENNQIQR